MTDLTLQARAGYHAAAADHAERVAVASKCPYAALTPDAIAWEIGAWFYRTRRSGPAHVRISPASWCLSRYHLVHVDDQLVRWSPETIEIIP
jgi:hypothetical protein